MTNILVSLSGNCSTNQNLIDKDFTEIIGVDNGAMHLFNRSLTPTTVLGDLDSIESSLLKKIKIMDIDLINYETDKDKTDFELSLNNIDNPKEKNIYLIGGEGGEVDHLFSIFSLIINYEFAENLTWFYKDKTIIFKTNVSVKMELGSNFSIIPITQLESLTITGAKWDVNKIDVKPGSTKTLRNISISDEVTINCEDGLFSVIY
jgi:thiamine pyrophosphokinase